MVQQVAPSVSGLRIMSNALATVELFRHIFTTKQAQTSSSNMIDSGKNLPLYFEYANCDVIEQVF